ncbi:outer membrane adhesin like protein [Pseudovibrio sp. FO-BEG1]|nr:outer membrane adhesin like protein [Pseudovibrio sp. FO-BEG1]
MNENGEVEIRVFFQDFDLGDTHSLELHSEDMIGSGTVIDEETFRYDPGTAFDYLKPSETATDTFSYTVTDSSGATSTQTVTITITGQNDGPVAVSVAAETDENTSVAITPDFSDADVGDSHTFTVDTADTKGAVVVNEDGTFAYDPNGAFDYLKPGETATDTFTYTVTDAAGESSTETVTVTINGVVTNTSPDTFPYEFTTDEDSKIVFRTIFHDPDVGDTHTYSLNTDGLKGTLIETGDGVFEYDPSIDFDYLAVGETATTTFTYTVTDSHGASDTDTITITVTGRNDAPVAAAMNVSTTESSALVIVPDFVDPDTTDTHTFTVDTSSTTGTVTINDDGTFTYNPNGQFDDLDQGESGTDSFTYTVTDASGVSSTETVTVTVNGESEANIQPVKIKASDGDEYDRFGSAVQINDKGVIVTGSANDYRAENSGIVYVYIPDGEGGFRETKLVASDGAKNDFLGAATAINNSGVIAVSAHDDDKGFQAGAIYVYSPTIGGGYDEVKLTATDAVIQDYLGQDLVINDTGVIVAGAFNRESDRVVVFTPDGDGRYSQVSLPVPEDGQSSNRGIHINNEGVISVGGKGVVSIFTPNSVGGFNEQILTSPDSNRSFGQHVAVENDGTIIVSGSDEIYIYEPDGAGNYAISKFAADAYFAFDMNTNGVIVVGNAITGNGIVEVFRPDDAGGYTRFKLTAFDGAAYDYFGGSVSITDNGTIIVGANADDDKGRDSGSIYVFTPNEDGSYTGPDGTVYEPTGPVEITDLGLAAMEYKGSDANDALQGGELADTFSGNGGDDVIDGGAGDDVLTGGEGKDTFVFAAGETGHDTIKDFAGGEGASDVIEFEASVFADFDAVLAAAAQDGANTVISIDEDTSITLEGVTLSDLHQDDFSFV